jgi:glucose/arabinose dehydrogenase
MHRRRITPAGLILAASMALVGCTDPQAHPSIQSRQISATSAAYAPLAAGWPIGETPRTAKGLVPTVYASGLDHPGELFMLPNGDLLVAESSPAGKPTICSRIHAWLDWTVSTQPNHRITLLRDADKDGISDVRTVFLEQKDAATGMALVGDEFYVATGGKVLRFKYETGSTKIASSSERSVATVARSNDKSRLRSIVANKDGSRIYAATQPTPTDAENIVGEASPGTILEIERSNGKVSSLGHDLRSPVGLVWGPGSDILWTSIVEKTDGELKYSQTNSLKSVHPGSLRRCVYCRFAPPDARNPLESQRPNQSGSDRSEIAPHAPAMTGLVTSEGTRETDQFAAGIFVDRHRSGKVGSEVVFVPFLDGSPSADPIVVMTGFVDSNDVVRGRPSGLAIDAHGRLLVADDLGGVVWRVSDTAPDDRLPSAPGKSLRARRHEVGSRK